MRRRVVFGFAVAVFLVAGLGFAYKMAEFVVTMVHDEIAGFGAVAVGTYLVGMVPIVCVTLWAVLTGRFRDIEAPKLRMLELQDELDAAEGRRG
jgi:hypothetical protein